MNVVAIIQARMGSTRLPGKSLIQIAGRPLIVHVIERARAASRVSNVILATTVDSEDDALEAVALENSIACYRGSTDDVLDRFYQAAIVANADLVVRITADDPFKDPDIIDALVQCIESELTLDYVSNTIVPTFPEGLDVEVFRFTALHRSWKNATLASEREHVTPYIWKNPHLFQIKNFNHSKDLSHLRWTLDYPEDLDFTRQVYDRLYRGHIFKMADILHLLAAEPQLSKINHQIERNSGYQSSLKKEQLKQS